LTKRLPLHLLLPVPFVAWAIYCLAQGERRWEHFLLLVVAPVLTVAGDRWRRMLVLIYPMGLIGLLYDSMRFFKDVGLTPSRVHVCDLRALDTSLFGIGGRSLPEWFQDHTSDVADVYFSIPYGVFLFAVIGYAVYLYFRAPDRMRVFTWSYFFLNVAGFVTYHLYPAAPPWYVDAHGCAVDLAAHASAGPRLEHVDAILGTPFFQSFYGRSNDVFGAVPSLHVAYPIILLVAGWSLHKTFGRTLQVLFLVSMVGGAVYLDHHWIIDILLGGLYGVLAALLARAVFAEKRPVPTGGITEAERAT
jgi:membrane-associated phospholipid phosphatase